MDHEIVTRHRRTAAELARGAQWAFRARPWLKYYRLGAAIFMALLMARLYSDEIRGTPWFALIPVAVGLAIYLLLKPLMIRSVLGRFATRPDRDTEIEWRITPDLIRTNWAHGKAETSWQAYAEVIQIPDGFLFFAHSRLFHWLPRAAFTTDADFDQLAQIAAEKAREFRRIK